MRMFYVLGLGKHFGAGRSEDQVSFHIKARDAAPVIAAPEK